MDALTSRLSTRFLVVTVAPNVLFLLYVGFLLAAGAPAHSPSLTRAIRVLHAVTLTQLIVLLIAVLIVSVATHPLQTPLIQFLEGYWEGLPFGRAVAKRCANRFRRELRWVQQEINRAEKMKETGKWDAGVERSYNEALRRQNWLPSRAEYLLPTVLGNTLLMGESRAGDRYGLRVDIAMPRLVPLLSPQTLAELQDRRNQLDVAVRLCLASGLATAVGVCLLLWHGRWLFLPLVTYLLCWVCYQAAVGAARGFSASLAAAIDLHHLRLFDAMQMARPADPIEERDLNATLMMLFLRLPDQDVDDLRYVAPKADGASAE